jgi:hypothetical protein
VLGKGGGSSKGLSGIMLLFSPILNVELILGSGGTSMANAFSGAIATL